MKILIVGTGIFPVPPTKGGGVENHIFNLTKALAKLGHEIYYVGSVSHRSELRWIKTFEVNTTVPDEPLKFEQWLFFAAKGELSVCKKLLEILQKNKFDLIHLHEVRGNIPGIFLSLLRKAPIVFTMHGLTPWMSKFDSFFEEKLRKFLWFTSDLHILKHAAHIIVVNKAIQNHLVLNWNIPKHKITYIPNGISLSIFSFKSNTNIQEKYGLPPRYCLFVGQLIRRKGIKCLLEAVDITPNVKCVVVGSGPERLRLIDLFSRLESNGKIIYLGNVPFEDLIGIYKGADFLVLPSFSEALPLTLLEAMASGIPVVTFDLPGFRDLVIDGYNGFLIPLGDVKRLSERMRFLAENIYLCKNMGENAKKVVENYDWSNIAKKTIEVYEHVIKS